VLGTPLDLNGKSYQTIEILQPGLKFLSPPLDLYLPLGLFASSTVQRSDHQDMQALGLLKPGITLTQALTSLDAIMQRLALSDPGPEDNHRSYGAYLTDETTSEIRRTLFVLLAAACLVLGLAERASPYPLSVPQP